MKTQTEAARLVINDHSINFYFYSTQSQAQSFAAAAAAAGAGGAVGQFYGRCFCCGKHSPFGP